MSDKIIKGTIANMETGESSNLRLILFPNESKFSTIAKIMNAESYVRPDDSFQISIECQALDSVGKVYNLQLEFSPY